MLVKIISGGCNMYPRYSYHNIKDFKSRKLIGHPDIIPSDYKLEEIKEEICKFKNCPECDNIFDLNHPFINGICIRSWEKQHITGDFDLYRKTVEEFIRNQILKEKI